MKPGASHGARGVQAMPELARHGLTDEQARAIHAAYLRGDSSIEHVAEAIGFTAAEARRRIRELKLPLQRASPAPKPALSPANAEQRVITGLLMARVDELRRVQGLSVERLAGECDVSMWTLERMRGGGLIDPRLNTVLRLCRGLGIPPGALLDELPLPRAPRPRLARTRGLPRT